MNIIFLDVDGVINSMRSLKEAYEKDHKPHSGVNYPFDKKCLKYLRFLVKETNSRIVITSSWRLLEDHLIKLLDTLEKYGLDKYVMESTPRLGSREEEIKEYLNICRFDASFVILDNEPMEELGAYAVKTDQETGLTEEDVKKAIKILLKQNQVKEFSCHR